MADVAPQLSIRKRLGDLDTKGYYLLVALSFVYRSESATWLLKLAFTLTAVAVVPPIQDLIESTSWLKRIRDGKSALLCGALICALFWIWRSHLGTPR
jgi:hypothetical protein